MADKGSRDLGSLLMVKHQRNSLLMWTIDKNLVYNITANTPYDRWKMLIHWYPPLMRSTRTHRTDHQMSAWWMALSNGIIWQEDTQGCGWSLGDTQSHQYISNEEDHRLHLLVNYLGCNWPSLCLQMTWWRQVISRHSADYNDSRHW